MSQHLRRPSKILINGVPVDPFERRIAPTACRIQHNPLHRADPPNRQNNPAPWDLSDYSGSQGIECMPARRSDMNGSRHRQHADQIQTVDHIQIPQDHVVVIGANVKVTGDISNCTKCEIYGHVEGSVAASRVIVHKEAIIDGSLLAWTADIHGHLKGDAVVRDVVNAQATSSIEGTLVYSRLNLQPGGRISASIRIQDPSWFEQFVAGGPNKAPTPE